MNAGQFFELDRASRLNDGIAIFRYKRIYQLSPDKYKPIYLVIKSKEVVCYFSDKSSQENSILFELHYLDYQNPRGKLYRELRALYPQRKKTNYPNSSDDKGNFFKLQTTDSAYKTYSELPAFWPDTHGIVSGHTLAPPIVENSGGNIDISLRMLLLDFLFDLVHSRVFAQSPNFDQLKMVMREHVFLNALLAKAELYFQADRLAQASAMAAGVKELINEEAQAAKDRLLNILIQQESPTVLSGSKWFRENMEEELTHAFKALVSSPKRRSPILSATIAECADWYIKRFHFLKAFQLIFKAHHLYKFLMVIPLMLFAYFFVVAFNVPEEAGLKNYAPWIGYGITGLLIAAGISVLWVGLNNFLKFRLTPLFNLFLPRFSITLIITWMAFAKLLALTDLSWGVFMFYMVLILTLIPVYLFREIKAQAPDLRGVSVFLRICAIICFGLLFTYLAGSIVLDIFYETYAQEEGFSTCLFSSHGNFHYSFWVLGFYTPMVLFSTLFLNFLFKGQRFTGY